MEILNKIAKGLSLTQFELARGYSARPMNRFRPTLDQTQLGYRRMTGDIGRQLLSAARASRARVEIVFTSFGLAQNHRYFGQPEAGPEDRHALGHDPLW